MSDWDVVVIGSGNAGMSAAHAARRAGARVLVADVAPDSWAGGNSYFTAGAIRTVHPGLPDVAPILDCPDEPRLARTRLAPYTDDEYLQDLVRVTGGRCDRTLAHLLVGDSWPTIAWLREVGIRFRLMYERQAYRTGDLEQFWGGLAIGTVDGGKGLVAQHFAAAERAGVTRAPEHRLTGLEVAGDCVRLGFHSADGERRLTAGAVVVAAGGFEADANKRAEHLGDQWRRAKVRGTPYNTGRALDLLIQIGAMRYGDWPGCHATQWDRGAPDVGDRELTNRYTKQSYPLGIVVNIHGDRFIDEGEDFRNLTYAKYGRAVLSQPDATAFQVFDAKTTPMLRSEEYDVVCGTRFEANTIRELAERCGIPQERLQETVDTFNAAVNVVPFDPTIKDGKAARAVSPPKSNWAQRIDVPPFVAYAVTGAITFTFGGVRIDTEARVLDARADPIPRVFAAGELVGGLFYDNYPGGSGLMAGAVFGRRAGRAAAATAIGSGRIR